MQARLKQKLIQNKMVEIASVHLFLDQLNPVFEKKYNVANQIAKLSGYNIQQVQNQIKNDANLHYWYLHNYSPIIASTWFLNTSLCDGKCIVEINDSLIEKIHDRLVSINRLLLKTREPLPQFILEPFELETIKA